MYSCENKAFSVTEWLLLNQNIDTAVLWILGLLPVTSEKTDHIIVLIR